MSGNQTMESSAIKQNDKLTEGNLTYHKATSKRERQCPFKTPPPRKPSILIIGPKPPPYHGVSVAIEMLLGNDLKAVFDVYHVDLADQRGIQHVDKPDLYDVLLFLQQIYQVLEVLFRRRPSIAYLPISQRNVGFIRDSIFVFLCYAGGCKVMLHLHGGNFKKWYEQRHPILRRSIRIVLNRVTAMIVLSESFKTIFNGLLPLSRVFVVSNGVEYQAQGNNVKGVLQKTRMSRITVLYLGTLNRYKGVLVLIKSIPLVIGERHDIRFVMAGAWSDDTDRKEAEAFISTHRLWRFVEFVGTVRGITKWKILENSDIFVFPGVQQEGQPLVVLEAMAAGLPIIYTDTGCLREMVIDGVNGLQIKSGDHIDVANKILKLVQNPCLLAAIENRNRELYRNKYTAKHYINSMLSVFTRISKNSDF